MFDSSVLVAISPLLSYVNVEEGQVVDSMFVAPPPSIHGHCIQLDQC
jgi:hypothetical protein